MHTVIRDYMTERILPYPSKLILNRPFGRQQLYILLVQKKSEGNG